MAATLASVCYVPLTSVLLLFELTKDYRILLPLMVIFQLSFWNLKRIYATSISPPAAQQIISSINVILGKDGSSRGPNKFDLSTLNQFLFTITSWFLLVFVHIGAQKLAQIRENSNYFRSELQKMGFEVLGDNDSPVMPIMLYNPAKLHAFSRECLKRNVCFIPFLHS